MKEKLKKISLFSIVLIGILFSLFTFAQNINNEFIGTLAVPGTLRECSSIDCKVIRYYAETARIEIVGLDESKEWYQVSPNDDYGNKLNGWIHYSVFVEDFRDSFRNIPEVMTPSPEITPSVLDKIITNNQTKIWVKLK